VDVTLAVLLAVVAVVGAYAIGQPLVQSPHLDPQFYKKIFGLLLLVVGFDMVAGVTDALRQRQAPRATPMEREAARRVGGQGPAFSASWLGQPGEKPLGSTEA
jgi:uncharacterized membrane protein YfcA